MFSTNLSSPGWTINIFFDTLLVVTAKGFSKCKKFLFFSPHPLRCRLNWKIQIPIKPQRNVSGRLGVSQDLSRVWAEKFTGAWSPPTDVINWVGFLFNDMLSLPIFFPSAISCGTFLHKATPCFTSTGFATQNWRQGIEPIGLLRVKKQNPAKPHDSEMSINLI